jgi:radical SAM superfamily enzyme YgiQ (UPF0313 family)
MPESTNAAADIELSDIGEYRSSGGTNPPAEQVRQAPVGSAPAAGSFRVALVNMPFASTIRASIQIGLLKAIAQRAGFEVEDHYLNLDLASTLGVDLYEECSIVQGYMTGEWLFSVAAFGEMSNGADFFARFPDEAHRFADRMGRSGEIDEVVRFLNRLRDKIIPTYIDACFDRIDWQSYRAVGFSSTFQQNVASLALAQRIKAKYPGVSIIFGGANMDGEMGVEYVRAFPCIDYAVIGEGDSVFPALLTCLAEGREPHDIVGVASRCGEGVAFLGPAAIIQDLNALPTPDYGTYYNRRRQLGIDIASSSAAGASGAAHDVNGESLTVHDAYYGKARTLGFIEDPRFADSIPFEGSRGCWWGEKSHCTFCGFNLTAMAYRSKSPERARAELDELSRRYENRTFWAVDNILDLKYVNGLFSQLGESCQAYRFFFESKANLTREQIRTLHAGGLRSVQPGIESLSSRILKLMRKGSTKLHNLTILKWCRYYDIHVYWALLHGFPGERVEDYIDQMATLKLITHLEPPLLNQRLWLERFSPLYRDEELFPKRWRRPEASYAYVYPDQLNLEKAAYFFDYELANVLPEMVHVPTSNFVGHWGSLWRSERIPELTYRRSGSEILIDDTRSGQDSRKSYTLAAPDADIYEAFSSAPRTTAQACAALAARCSGLEPAEESVAEACGMLCDAGLMIGDAGKFLSLAIPADAAVD